MIDDSAAPEQPRETAPLPGDQNTLPVVITVAVLMVMAVVIAIDFQSVPGLALFALVAMGGLIAAYAYFG